MLTITENGFVLCGAVSTIFMVIERSVVEKEDAGRTQ